MSIIPQWAEAIVDGIDVECGDNLPLRSIEMIGSAIVHARQNGLFEAARLFEQQAATSTTAAGRTIFEEVATILRTIAASNPGECAL